MNRRVSEVEPSRKADSWSLSAEEDFAEVAEAMTKSTIVGSAAPENYTVGVRREVLGGWEQEKGGGRTYLDDVV